MANPRFRPAFAAIGASLLLAACASNSVGPTQVTRFHLGQPIAPADIAIEPRPGAGPRGPEFETYAGIVASELTRLGFRPAANLAGSEMVAVVDVSRGGREGRPRGSGLSIGLGGGTGGGYGGGLGVGGGISFPVGKARSGEIVGTMLSVQLKRRSDSTVIWEGRARTEARADTPAADPDQAVRRLATALFQGFPGESGRTITVK
jgi:hypothetical protein